MTRYKEQAALVPVSPMNDWWRQGGRPVTHVVIDMVYDFIDGDTGLGEQKEAVKYAAEYINASPNESVVCRDCIRQITARFRSRGRPVACPRGEGSKKGVKLHKSFIT